MKKYALGLGLAVIAAGALIGCKHEYETYEGPDYVMFADTLQTLAIQDDETYYDIPVSATTACDYDRTYAVEIVDKGSNAVEGKHYDLASNNIVIKAGELASSVKIRGHFSNLEVTDSLGVTLRLVADKSKLWDLYGTDTKVVFQKVCPFDENVFAGYVKMTSTFFDEYMEGTKYRLLVSEVSKDPEDKPHTIILKDYLYKGGDMKVTLSDANPLEPNLNWDSQVIGTTSEAFGGAVYGDDKLRVMETPGSTSYFSVCENFMLQYITIYVLIDGKQQAVGNFLTLLEWISEEEYNKLKQDIVGN